MSDAVLAPRGDLRSRVIAAPPARPQVITLDDAERAMTPRRFRAFGNREVAAFKRENAPAIERSLAEVEAYEARQSSMLGQLWLRKVDRDGVGVDFGLVSCRVVTTAGVSFIVDAWQNLVELETMRFHGVGTGTTAESVSQTALVTELTTQYQVANTRVQGSLGEQANVPNAFETTATITLSASAGITEHGIFSQAATGGGVLMDRSVFAVINLAASESLQATWRLQFPAGG